MASIRPTTRLLHRLTTTSKPILSQPTHRIKPTNPFPQPPPLRTLHSTTLLLKEDASNPSSTAHTGSVAPRTHASNDAYPNGPPGTPKPGDSLPSGIAPSKIYTFAEIQNLSSTPHKSTLLIDVREPSELLNTGRIPNAVNIPVKSAADAFFLGKDEFEDMYGFARPGAETEVVFYCKAGVRSRAAARLAGQSGFGGKVGEFPGSWDEWVAKGGRVQRE